MNTTYYQVDMDVLILVLLAFKHELYEKFPILFKYTTFPDPITFDKVHDI